MSHPHRCTDKAHCGRRVSLSKHIDEYTRRPMCPGCGKDRLKSVKTYERARNKRLKCMCDGLPFPHRAGSTVWCAQHSTGPSEADFIERYGNYES